MIEPPDCADVSDSGRHAMDETTATREMRVATLNLWGRRGAWEERRRVLAEGFRELAPDLVAFQRRLSATATTRLPTSSVPATASSTRPIERPPGAETSRTGKASR